MQTYTLADWLHRAQALAPEGRAFIDGRYVPALSGAVFDCVSPRDGRVLTQVAQCDAADANVAVIHARKAFDSGIWSQATPVHRKNVLVRLSELVLEHAEELALLESLDMGKPIGDAMNVDIPASARALRWCGEAVDKIYDEVATTPSDQLGLVTRQAIGVVAAIVPWNFPLIMACWKLGPALAAGNSAILKPSEKSPLTALRLAALALEAGLPAGVLNVLPGFGHTVGKALALHQDVDTVVFTGSTKVAGQLMAYAGESNLKRVWLEAGGKSPNIVFADMPDFDKAAEAAAAAIAYNQGEVCTAGSRLLVQNSVKARFVERVLVALKQWRAGDPLDPQTNVGAIVDEVQLKNIERYIDLGEKEGATLKLGGQRVQPVSGGWYIEPALFDGVSNNMTIAQEEIFGPVLSVIGFEDEAEAIQIANDSKYGLAAAVWTSDLSRAHRVARALRAGSVWVNQYDGGDMTAPFGGFKQSGNGRDKSLHAFDKYTEMKATWIQL